MSWDESLPSWEGGSSDVVYARADIKTPPAWPLAAQAVLVVASVMLFCFASVSRYLAFSALGYVLTPFLTVALLAFLRASDLSNRSLPWYDKELGKRYLKISGALVVVSFLVAVPVIWRLAIEVAQELGI